MKQKIVSFFFKPVSQAMILTTEERAAMIQNRNPLGTTVPAAQEQLKREIQQEGIDAVKLKLVKEKALLDELTAQLSTIKREALNVVTASLSVNPKNRNMKASLEAASKHLVQNSLDYATNKALLETQASLHTRQLALQGNQNLFQEVCYNSSVNQKN